MSVSSTYFDIYYCNYQLDNGDHSPNFFRQTSLLFHRWLAEHFNLDDAWLVKDGYKNTSIYNALITWIGKFCKFVHKQNCSHDFFYCINYNIMYKLDKLLLKQKKLPVLRDIHYGPLLFLIVLYLILTTIALEQLTTERQGY